MCGRIVQATSPEEIAREFGADLSVALRESLSTPAPGDTSLIRAEWYPRWNMAPSSRALVIAPYRGERGEGRQLGADPALAEGTYQPRIRTLQCTGRDGGDPSIL